VNSNPQDNANLILLGKVTYNKMIQNPIWVTGYIVVSITLAAVVFYSWGFAMDLTLGPASMSLSTIIVAINAQLLKRKISKSK
jgi:Cu2+-exporting ATPase